ncbi:hypothetical protein BJ170DRAFT_480804 [Xylariales sp. AK1849]|nr:hypothetical protein BJ170DRAFT_480804 [Xylariales sp. AK1849]
MADIQVIHAYRQLYRSGLRAVQFSKPARYVYRDRLRVAFREKDAKLEPTSVARTVQFLEAAGRTRGLEHKVLKNLLMVAFYRHFAYRQSMRRQRISNERNNKQTDFTRHTEATAFKHYDMTLAMLNRSMGLCLR